jgi:hypothetical protein
VMEKVMDTSMVIEIAIGNRCCIKHFIN